MKTLKTFATYAFTLTALLSTMPACLDGGEEEEEDADGKSDSGAPVVSADNLNGMWVTTLAGTKQKQDTMILSWSQIGIQMRINGKVLTLTRNGDKLTGEGVALDIQPNASGVRDDSMTGKIDGKDAKLTRNTFYVTKSPPVAFPGDRPWRVWLDDVSVLAQQDRETYQRLDYTEMKAFLTRCELYKGGSWLRQLKGANWTEQKKQYNNIMTAMDKTTTTPHAIVGNFKFQTAVKAAIVDQSKVGLLLSSFGMYFSTAGGGALRFQLASDATAYFITDRPVRSEKIGLVVMDTPTHGPLASTFGRQLLDLAEMPATDDTKYTRSMMELVAKSSNKSVESLSGVGKSAITDWWAVMAIEDYRGTAFGNPELGWGYNMTNVQFFGLVAKALARPGQTDSAGKPVIGQVVVGTQLRPGDASYSDVLNNGNDMQEYPDMSAIKTAASNFLKEKHGDKVAAVEAAFSTILPRAQAGFRAQTDIFHYITENLYDSQKRYTKLVGPVADRAIDATVALVDVLRTDSAAFEAYLLSHGFTKSNEAAPKSDGF